MDYTGTDLTKFCKDSILWRIGTEEDPLELHVFPPTKEVNDALEEMASVIDSAIAGEFDDRNLMDYYPAVARLLSNNRERREVTVEYLESINFDMADLSVVVSDYFLFLNMLVESKN